MKELRISEFLILCSLFEIQLTPVSVLDSYEDDIVTGNDCVNKHTSH